MTIERAAAIELLVRQFAEALDFADMYASYDYEMHAFWQGRALTAQAQLEDMGAVIRNGVVTWPNESNGQQE